MTKNDFSHWESQEQTLKLIKKRISNSEQWFVENHLRIQLWNASKYVADPFNEQQVTTYGQNAAPIQVKQIRILFLFVVLVFDLENSFLFVGANVCDV